MRRDKEYIKIDKLLSLKERLDTIHVILIFSFHVLFRSKEFAPR